MRSDLNDICKKNMEFAKELPVGSVLLFKIPRRIVRKGSSAFLDRNNHIPKNQTAVFLGCDDISDEKAIIIQVLYKQQKWATGFMNDSWFRHSFEVL